MKRFQPDTLMLADLQTTARLRIGYVIVDAAVTAHTGSAANVDRRSKSIHQVLTHQQTTVDATDVTTVVLGGHRDGCCAAPSRSVERRHGHDRGLAGVAHRHALLDGLQSRQNLHTFVGYSAIQGQTLVSSRFSNNSSEYANFSLLYEQLAARNTRSPLVLTETSSRDVQVPSLGHPDRRLRCDGNFRQHNISNT